MLIESAEGL